MNAERMSPRSAGRPGVRPPVSWQEEQRLMHGAGRLRSEWLGALIARVAGYVRERWLEPLGRRRQRRTDLRGLLALDDRVLADIGLRRADLEAVRHGLVPWEQAFSRGTGRVGTGAPVVALPRPAQPATAPGHLDRAA